MQEYLDTVTAAATAKEERRQEMMNAAKAKDNQLTEMMARVDARDEQMNKKYEQIIELIAQLTTSSGNSGGRRNYGDGDN